MIINISWMTAYTMLLPDADHYSLPEYRETLLLSQKVLLHQVDVVICNLHEGLHCFASHFTLRYLFPKGPFVGDGCSQYSSRDLHLPCSIDDNIRLLAADVRKLAHKVEVNRERAAVWPSDKLIVYAEHSALFNDIITDYMLEQVAHTHKYWVLIFLHVDSLRDRC